MATKSDVMRSTVDSWASFGGSNVESRKGSKATDKMANTGDSWFSTGSWRNVPVQLGAQLKEVVYARSSPFKIDVTDRMLLDCFRQLDHRGDGVIPSKMLYKAFHKCGFRVSKAAMQAVMRDMGLDPAEGIDSQDFVIFFRRAEELTDELDYQKKPRRCGMRFCLCTIFCALVACCAFIVLLMVEQGDKTRRDGYRLGLTAAGSILGFLICIALLLPLFGRKVMDAIPLIIKCCQKCRCDWIFSARAPKVPDAKVVNTEKKRVIPAVIRFHSEIEPSSYRPTDAAGSQQTEAHLTVNIPAQPAVCQAAMRSHSSHFTLGSGSHSYGGSSFEMVPAGHLPGAATTHSSHFMMTAGNHSHGSWQSQGTRFDMSAGGSLRGGAQHNKQPLTVPSSLRGDFERYDPSAYRQAAQLGNRPSPVGTDSLCSGGGMTSNLQGAQRLASIPHRPGAATKGENSKAATKKFFEEAVEAGQPFQSDVRYADYKGRQTTYLDRRRGDHENYDTSWI